MTAYDTLVAAQGAQGYWKLDDASNPFAPTIGTGNFQAYLGTVTPQAGTILGTTAAGLSGSLVWSDPGIPLDTWTDYTLLIWCQETGDQPNVSPLYLGNVFDNGLGTYVGGHHDGGTGSEFQGVARGVGWVDSTPDTLTFNAAHLLGISYTAGNAQLYLDGLPVGAPTAITPGALPSGPEAFIQFEGLVALASVYDVALSDSDVLAHWSTLAAPRVDGGLVIGTTIDAFPQAPPHASGGFKMNATIKARQGPFLIGEEAPHQRPPAAPPLPVSTDPGIVVPTDPWLPEGQYRSDRDHT